MEIQLVGPHQIDQVWPAIRAKIDRAIVKGNATDITLSDVYAMCRSGHGFLFVTENLDSALVLRFERETRGEAARIIAFAADQSRDWNEFIKPIEEFAVSNGAERIVTDGRYGWKRKMKNFKVDRVAYSMELKR